MLLKPFDLCVFHAAPGAVFRIIDVISGLAVISFINSRLRPGDLIQFHVAMELCLSLSFFLIFSLGVGGPGRFNHTIIPMACVCLHAHVFTVCAVLCVCVCVQTIESIPQPMTKPLCFAFSYAFNMKKKND